MSSLTFLVELSFPATGQGCRQRLHGDHSEPTAKCGAHLDGLQVSSANQSPGGPAERLLSVASGWNLRPTFLMCSQATAGLLLLRLHLHLASHRAFCIHSVQFSSVQSLSRVQLFATPWTAAHQASLSFTNSWSLLKLMSTESVMTSKHLILCRPLLLLPSIFPSMRVLSNESVFHIRWLKYWSFSFSISPSKEHPGLISFRWTGWISLQSKGLSGVFSNTTVQKHQFFSAQLSL